MNDAVHDEFIQLHVVAKNLQSIQAKERFEDCMVELDTFEFDLLLLSETWRGDREEHFTTTGGHKVFLSGGSPGRRGVGICISKKLLNKIDGVLFFVTRTECALFTSRWAQFDSRCFHATCRPHGNPISPLNSSLNL